MEYSSCDVDMQVRNFIYGLFGKGSMMLFGCGYTRKIEFATEDNFPSTLRVFLL
jgi:hypothetical protein